MKVICDRGALAEALNLASGVVLTRTPKPILFNVKLTAADGRLTVAATDLEVGLVLEVDQVEVQEEGSTLVLANKLTSIVKESVDPTIRLESDADVVHVIGADSHYRIFAQNPEQFPPVASLEGDADFEVAGKHLHDLIARTIFATARETSRYAINGVLLERDGKKLTFVATDGRRLALAKGSCSTSSKDTISCIVPSKALQMILRIFVDPEEVVKVKIATNQAHFAGEGATLTTNLVEGNFPPYKDVIPKDQDRKVEFSTDMLMSGVRRAALLTNDETKGVKFTFGGELLTLASRAPEMGEAEVTVPLEDFNGEAIEIGFNPFFITDALKVVDSKKVNLELKASNKPGVIRVGNDFLYVIMPVSL